MKNNRNRHSHAADASKKKVHQPHKIIVFISLLLSFLFLLFACSARWMLATWGKLTMDEVIIQLSTGIIGTGGGMIQKYLLGALLPCLLIMALICILLRKNRGKKSYGIILRRSFLASFAAFVILLVITCVRLDAVSFIRSQTVGSTFIEDNYVDPDKTSITFPEKKRNLIYIVLESIEVTYADEENGGAFSNNVIDELTQLSEENENFGGSSGVLNGGYSLTGATWTMGGIFAQTSGLPLKIALDNNVMSSQNSFFADVTNIGDILQDEGYHNVFLLGSDAVFGGRQTYFTSHGGYDIYDYTYAKEQGWIPPDYNVWWGYEDEKLFSFARDSLTEMAAQDEPFNLTLLTVDTHFENGYVCDLCTDEYGEDRYSNVIACSDRQVTEFVRWVQQQDFYENTTIVISGDHPTMDVDYCINVPENYDRKVYTAYINAAAAPEEPDRVRQYSTMDDFPTTIAALGAKIKGDRLGLGANLFSGEDTLIEEYGLAFVENELTAKSQFMIDLAGLKESSPVLSLSESSIEDIFIEVTDYVESTGTATVTVDGLVNYPDAYEGVRLQVDSREGKKLQQVDLELQDSGVWAGEIDVSLLEDRIGRLRVMVRTGRKKYEEISSRYGDVTMFRHRYSEDYLDMLGQLDPEEYTILMATRDDISRRATMNEQKLLQELGLTIELGWKSHWAMLAVITADDIYESFEENTVLTHTGTLPDGKPYSMSSAGYANGDFCDITIDGVECAEIGKGLNIVVYNNRLGTVVDSCSFNMNRGMGFGTLIIDDYSQRTGIMHLSVSDLYYRKATERDCYLYIWDEQNPMETQSVLMTYDEERDVYTAEVDTAWITSGRYWIAGYIYDYKEALLRFDTIHGLLGSNVIEDQENYNTLETTSTGSEDN